MEAPREEEILQLSTMKNACIPKHVFLNREVKIGYRWQHGWDWPSISHTYNQKEAWWQVSLPSAYPVSSYASGIVEMVVQPVRQRLFPFFLLLSDDSPFNDKTCPNPSVCNSLKDAKVGIGLYAFCILRKLPRRGREG